MKLRTIILNTFKEAVRKKLLFIVFSFSLLLLAASTVLVPLSLGEESKIIMDIGLGSISIFGILLAILIGSQLVFNELERKTIYFIISKPVRRETFIIGKFFGLLLTLTVVIFILIVWFYVILFLLTGLHPASLLISVFLSYLEIVIITAFCIFFSTFTSPIFSSLFTFLLFVIGRLAPDIQLFASKTGNPFAHFSLQFVYYIIPNLSNFNVRGMVVHSETVPQNHILFAIAYAFIYTIILLVASSEIFRRKDL